MTVQDLINQLATAPAQAHVALVIGNEPHRVLSATFTGYEPVPGVADGVAVIRVEAAQ